MLGESRLAGAPSAHHALLRGQPGPVPVAAPPNRQRLALEVAFGPHRTCRAQLGCGAVPVVWAGEEQVDVTAAGGLGVPLRAAGEPGAFGGVDLFEGGGERSHRRPIVDRCIAADRANRDRRGNHRGPSLD